MTINDLFSLVYPIFKGTLFCLYTYSYVFNIVHGAADILSLRVHIKQRGHNSNQSKGFQKSL